MKKKPFGAAFTVNKSTIISFLRIGSKIFKPKPFNMFIKFTKIIIGNKFFQYFEFIACNSVKNIDMVGVDMLSAYTYMYEWNEKQQINFKVISRSNKKPLYHDTKRAS